MFFFSLFFVFFFNLNLPYKWSWPITSPGLFVWDYFLCEKYLLSFIFLSFYTWCSFSLHQFHMQTSLTRSTCWLEKGRFRLKIIIWRFLSQIWLLTLLMGTVQDSKIIRILKLDSVKNFPSTIFFQIF